jgi:hypothetical protein
MTALGRQRSCRRQGPSTHAARRSFSDQDTCTPFQKATRPLISAAASLGSG